MKGMSKKSGASKGLNLLIGVSSPDTKPTRWRCPRAKSKRCTGTWVKMRWHVERHMAQQTETCQQPSHLSPTLIEQGSLSDHSGMESRLATSQQMEQKQPESLHDRRGMMKSGGGLFSKTMLPPVIPRYVGPTLIIFGICQTQSRVVIGTEDFV